MTTIAARRTPHGRWVIAADSQETVEGTDAGDIKLPCQKIFLLNDGGENCVFATAGDSGAGVAFIEHFRIYKTKPRELRTGDRAFECLVRDVSGRLWLWDEDLAPTEITLPFFAIGTGRMAAFAAMEEGADPRRAVEIAAKYDPYTGGAVVVAE